MGLRQLEPLPTTVTTRVTHNTARDVLHRRIIRGARVRICATKKYARSALPTGVRPADLLTLASNATTPEAYHGSIAGSGAGLLAELRPARPVLPRGGWPAPPAEPKSEIADALTMRTLTRISG